MPQLATNPVDIILDIPDIVIDTTVIKRKAKLFTLIYNMNSKQVSISWTIIHYSKNSDGSYGDSLSLIIPNYTREQIATNEVPVNPVTGVPINKEDIQPTITIDPITGEEIVTPSTIPWVGQYDFFNNIGENVSIKIHDVIRQFGATLQTS